MKIKSGLSDVGKISAMLILLIGVKGYNNLLEQVFPIINTSLAFAIVLETYNITIVYFSKKERRCHIQKIIWAYLSSVAALALVTLDWIYIAFSAWSAITWLEYIYYVLEVALLLLLLMGLKIVALTQSKIPL